MSDRRPSSQYAPLPAAGEGAHRARGRRRACVRRHDGSYRGRAAPEIPFHVSLDTLSRALLGRSPWDRTCSITDIIEHFRRSRVDLRPA